jgi:hypothetical protein
MGQLQGCIEGEAKQLQAHVSAEARSVIDAVFVRAPNLLARISDVQDQLVQAAKGILDVMRFSQPWFAGFSVGLTVAILLAVTNVGLPATKIAASFAALGVTLLLTWWTWRSWQAGQFDK